MERQAAAERLARRQAAREAEAAIAAQLQLGRRMVNAAGKGNVVMLGRLLKAKADVRLLCNP